MNPIVAVLVLSLSPAGATATRAMPVDPGLVEINGVAIKQSQVTDRLWSQYGARTMEEMINEELLRQAVLAAKIKPAAAEIDQRVARLRGKLSEADFEARLKKAGTSIDVVKREIGQALAREEVIEQAQGIKVTDSEVKAAFDKEAARLSVPEGVHLRHILVKTKSEASAIVDQIKNGADFKKLATEKSLAPTGKINGGDYGFVTRGLLPAAIEKVAFAMKAGDLKITSDEKGYHVLQAVERRAAVPAKLEQYQDDLRQALLRQKIQAALPSYLAQLRKDAKIARPSAQQTAAAKPSSRRSRR